MIGICTGPANKKFKRFLAAWARITKKSGAFEAQALQRLVRARYVLGAKGRDGGRIERKEKDEKKQGAFWRFAGTLLN
jgi:hypothetical protein